LTLYLTVPENDLEIPFGRCCLLLMYSLLAWLILASYALLKGACVTSEWKCRSLDIPSPDISSRLGVTATALGISDFRFQIEISDAYKLIFEQH
jgi:hypothetical protein